MSPQIPQTAFLQLPGAEVAAVTEATSLGSLEARPRVALDPTWQWQRLNHQRKGREMGGVCLEVTS